LKKSLQILGAVFGVLILAVIIFVAVFVVKGTALDKESTDFIDKVAPNILGDMTKEAFFTYASDEFKAAMKPDEFEKVLNVYRKLGHLRLYKGAKGTVGMTVDANKGKIVLGQYVAEAEFDRGPARLQIVTVKKGDRWFIQGFKIDSPAFMELMQ
jgi:hypothetical protein